MAITREDVRRIAALARIELDPAEEGRFERELSNLLAFVETLQSVDTDGVDALAGGTELTGRLRDDGGATPAGTPADLIAAAPDKKENWIKVKAVFN